MGASFSRQSKYNAQFVDVAVVNVKTDSSALVYSEFLGTLERAPIKWLTSSPKAKALDELIEVHGCKKEASARYRWLLVSSTFHCLNAEGKATTDAKDAHFAIFSGDFTVDDNATAALKEYNDTERVRPRCLKMSTPSFEILRNKCFVCMVKESTKINPTRWLK
ncbi:hypothetical protein DI09_65p80 [Mitosporidium daphniae]|uniref:Uncharacterized protein n=1 Tax=Mitosporidium daphniae TaxID=1485682 RepID=A0A098VNL7_9MICR|nr:uncharacterized protein DI09_65p80 [Mitosporidium daphniae]KGG50560.1 hypothetical protein DI09_65p80 [Mitosporidium daphniae]|eukprot:XP_013236999.1 uncharacterized protein DI09_65p80 [Mitosporidium daphniae]